MITILFKKVSNGIYVPHVDLLRALNRTFRRAGIEVAQSQGYNKHMLVNLTQPLPFGIGSEDDWVSVETINKISCDEMLNLFNEYCPDYLQAIYCKETTSYPNLSAKVNYCRYKVESSNALAKSDCIMKLKEGLILEYDRKGETIVKDVTSGIYSIEVNKDGIECILAFATNNVRIDLFCEHINKTCQLNIENEDITRTEQLIFDGVTMVSARQHMEGLI